MENINHTYIRESAFKKVQNLVRSFNDTFEIEAHIVKDDNTGEEITDGLRIKALKNDGSEFLDEIFDTLINMVHIASDNHELIYDVNKGFAIAKKKISYEIIDN